MSSFFIIILIILYKLYSSGAFSSSASYDERASSYVNSIAAPAMMVVRMSPNLTREKQNRINIYLNNVLTPAFFAQDTLRFEAYSTFDRYSDIDKNTLIRLVRDAGDTIIRTNQSTFYKKKLLKHLFELCRITGEMNSMQRDFIESFARKLGISARETYDEYTSGRGGDFDWNNQRSSYDQNQSYNYNYGNSKKDSNTFTSDLDKAYKTLGIDANATDEEIKTRKNKLLRKWHPDLYAQDGEEAIKKATQNSQRINEAYDIIKEHRGMN